MILARLVDGLAVAGTAAGPFVAGAGSCQWEDLFVLVAVACSCSVSVGFEAVFLTMIFVCGPLL